MSWVRALDLFFKGKDIYDKASDLKQLSDYAEKIAKSDPSKVKWDDLKYFENKQMTEATKQLRGVEAALDELIAAKFEPPESGSLRAFEVAMKAADKHGIKSKEAKAAVDAYRKVLGDYDRSLKSLLADMDKAAGEFPRRLAAAKSLKDYCNALEKAFLKAAELPFPGGTVMNAQFFSLSQDALQLYGIAGSVETKLGKAQSLNGQRVAELRELIDTNQAWIAWAGKDALAKDDTLKKNQKADTPKK